MINTKVESRVANFVKAIENDTRVTKVIIIGKAITDEPFKEEDTIDLCIYTNVSEDDIPLAHYDLENIAIKTTQNQYDIYMMSDPRIAEIVENVIDKGEVVYERKT